MDPYSLLRPDAPGRWVVTADHASNAVPDWLGGSLGLPDADMTRHIAWDIGAAGLARALAERLRGPALLGGFSRLVIDLNRGEDDPTLLMRLYDGTVIAGNHHADAAERERRLAALHRPYHAALASLLAARQTPVLLAIHSFTPQLQGRPERPWHVGVLHSHLDPRLARPLIDRLRRDGDLVVGDNQPYGGHLPGDSVDRHALAHGRLNVLVEVRQDLIATPDDQAAWADRLAPHLVASLADAEGNALEGPGSSRPDGAPDRRPAGLPDLALQRAEAAAFRRLREHLVHERPDVQNIDLMDLAGFCRNCLARWQGEALSAGGRKIEKSEARDLFYGEPYEAWLDRHQTGRRR